MDAMKAILTRRSIRKYTKKEIDKKTINELLEAAMSAPTAVNQKPWSFIVIDDKKILKEILDFHPNAKFLTHADKAILVCGDLSIEKLEGYWILDCTAATQNLLLAARAKELGGCWLGIYPREERMENIRKLLGIPTNVVPLALISLGYPAEKSFKKDRFDESKIHFNKW